jgi:hypothetical protein
VGARPASIDAVVLSRGGNVGRETEWDRRGWGRSAVSGGVEGRGMRAVQGSTRGTVALGRLGGGGFSHDRRKGTTESSGLSWAERLW